MMLHARPASRFRLTRKRLGLLVAFLGAFLFLLFLMMLFTARSAAAAPLGGNLSTGSPARDAVATLTAQGVVEGYPDGTYKGDRPMTRDEAARLLESLQTLLDEKGRDLVTQEEFQQFEQAVNALHDAMNDPEDAVDGLQQRVQGIDKRL